MFGIAAWRLGWHVDLLGQDTPIDTIRHAVAAVEPALVVLAVAEGTSLDRMPWGFACWSATSRSPWAAGFGPRRHPPLACASSRATPLRPRGRSSARNEPVVQTFLPSPDLKRTAVRR